MNNIQLAKGVYYVGAIDWNLRDFHGYTTPKGVTYNSYLVVDEKICLIDTVKKPFSSELIDRVSQIVDFKKIDYVVVNHVEPDHSSALPEVMEKAINAKVVITEQGRAAVLKHYKKEYDFIVVKEGDTLNLGKNNLNFVPLPMLHWPDSMVSYLDGEQILFSNDAFGQHYCSTKRFDYENDLNEILYEAAKYYANILMPFGNLAVRANDKLNQLSIKMIAPSHGVIWTKHISDIIEKYIKWASGKTDDKVIVVYESMWGATEKMARYILDGLASVGLKAKLYKLSTSDRSEIIWDILEAKGVIFGSPTLNNGMLPNMGGLLTYLKGLKPSGKMAAAFGAYGWAGGSQKAMEQALKDIGFNLDESGLTLKWVPDDEELDKCFNYGAQFGKMLKE